MGWGAGTARGGVAIELWRPSPYPAGTTRTTLVHVTQSLPWFMRVYWHTMRLTVDGVLVPILPAKRASDLDLAGSHGALYPTASLTGSHM
jgi:hypothetical protein